MGQMNNKLLNSVFLLFTESLSVFDLTDSELFVKNVNIFFFLVPRNGAGSSPAPFWSPVELQLKRSLQS